MQLARLRALGTRTHAEDLMQEAVTRTLAGQRQWPEGVPFVAFLAQTMRSIAFEERADAAQVVLHSEAAPALEADEAVWPEPSDDVTPEREYAARQALRAVDELFDGDDEARAVLSAVAENRPAEEIKAERGLTQTQYATILRRIRRRLDAYSKEQTK